MDDIALYKNIAPSHNLPTTVKEAEAYLRVLNVRREIMDRVFNIRRGHAKTKRYEAEILECMEQQKHKGQTNAVALDLEGRIDEAAAQMEYIHEKRTQYELEITAYKNLLIGDE